MPGRCAYGRSTWNCWTRPRWHAWKSFFESQQGRLGTFSFTDPWDGTVHDDCSLDSDSLALDFQDVMRGQATLIVKENGE